MNKTIQDNTIYIEANQLIKVEITETYQIRCRFDGGGLSWNGEIQKVYLDENGEAIGYDVYCY